MKLKYTAAAPLALISVFNLPIAFESGNIPPGIAWAISALGLIGLITVVALLLDRNWASPAATAVAATNLIAAGIALAADEEGAIVGLVLSAIAVVCSTISLVRRRTADTLSDEVELASN
jgi:hypothetical protein